MRIRLVLLALVIFPSITNASICSNLAVQINYDILKYKSAISSKQLFWMNLGWLKKNLGPAEIQKVSPTEKEFKWVCPDNTNAYIAVTADETGKINNVDGVYSSDEGTGMLSVCLNCKFTTPAKTPEVKTPPKVQEGLNQTTVLPQSLAKCTAVIKEIRDIGAKGSGGEKSYTWEDLSWLQKTFGAAELQQTRNVSGYEWKCDNQSLMYFKKDEQVVYGAAYCNEGECFAAYATRMPDGMKGFIDKIKPGG